MISQSKGLTLVIDEEVTERDEGTFYLLPSEMSKSGLLNPEKFDSCDIRNVDVDDIKPSSLLGILYLFPTRRCRNNNEHRLTQIVRCY